MTASLSIRVIRSSLVDWRSMKKECRHARHIFVFEKRLPNSMIQGVSDSPTQWYGKSTTLRITDTRSRRLPTSPIRRVGYWILKKKTRCIGDTESRRLPVSLSQGVADSAYRWNGESPTPVSLSRGVGDFAYRWYGESLVEKKISLASIFSTLNGWSMPLKD
jgi:hypothetical protein